MHAAPVLLLLLGAVASLRGTAQGPVRDRAPDALIGSATLSGEVLADDGRERRPLRRAIVTLSRAGVEDERATATDDRGRFQFDRLPAGTFTMTAGKGGYIAMNYGAPKPGMPGRAIVLRASDTYRAETMILLRGAVIAGTLRDRNGRSLKGVPVSATQYVNSGGLRYPRLNRGASDSARTNEHGEYRMFELPPGEYLVFADSVALMSETDSGLTIPIRYLPTMFPGVVNQSRAVSISLGVGEERVGVDFTMLHAPAVVVSGRVAFETGSPRPDVMVWRAPNEPNPFHTWAEVGTALAPDGTFVFREVPPGDYVIVARSRSAGGPAGQGALRLGYASDDPVVWGQTALTVSNSDVRDVSISLHSAPTFSGRLETDNPAPAGPAPGPIIVRVLPWPAIGATSSIMRHLYQEGTVRPDGTFLVKGLMPGRYRVTVWFTPLSTTAEGWAVQSAMLGGIDLLDAPLEIRDDSAVTGAVIKLTNSPTRVAGRLTDASGRPVSSLYVLVFAVDRALRTPQSRRTVTVRAGDNGSYVFDSLPAGEYYVCALTEVDPILRFDPDYLEQFAGSALKMTLRAGEHRVLDLSTGR